MILKQKNEPRYRVHTDNLQELFVAQERRDDASNILDYHDGNDIKYVKRKMAERYATEVTRVENSTTGEIRYNVIKTKAAQVAAIKNNLFEVVTRGMTKKVTNTVARLFSDSEFTYTNADTDDLAFTDDIETAREMGGFELMASRMDEMSVVVGSSAMLLQVLDNKFNYQPISPDKIFIVFNSQILSGEDFRPVNKLNIEDALCIVIQLSGGDSTNNNYVAYFGRSDEYEQGRFVKYNSSNWFDIPDVGAQNANDYIDGDMVANPLTVWQNQTRNYSYPEYPVVTWLGSNAGAEKTLLPISTRLFDASLEIDLSSSRTAMSANKSARGAWFFTNEGGASPNQPESLDEGISKLEAGQSVMVLSVPSSNIDTADKITNNITRYLGDSWGVPAYTLAISSNTIMPSGVALMELNRPAVQMQQLRYKINASSMERIFNIEKSLASIENGLIVGDNIEQYWDINTLTTLQTEIEKLTELKLQKEIGITDNANILIETKDNINTREQALEALAELEKEIKTDNTVNRLGLL